MYYLLILILRILIPYAFYQQVWLIVVWLSSWWSLWHTWPLEALLLVKNLFKQFATIRILGWYYVLPYFQMICTGGLDVETLLIVVKTLTVSYLINNTAPAMTKQKGHSWKSGAEKLVGGVEVDKRCRKKGVLSWRNPDEAIQLISQPQRWT